MENQPLLFDTISTLLHPVIILTQEAESWHISYANKAMTLLLEHEKSENEKTLPASLLTLIEQCGKTNEKELNFYNIDLFNKTFQIHVTQNTMTVFALFIEIQSSSFLKNIPLHDLSDACSAIVIILDEQGNLIDMNNCFLNLVKMKKEDILAQPFFELFIPGDQQKLQHFMHQIHLENVHSQHFITPLKTSEGTIYNINWQVSKKIVKNNHIYIVAVGSDISKIVRENRKLKQQIVSIKVGFDNFPFGIAYMNAQGVFTTMNPRFKKMFSLPQQSSGLSFEQVALLKKHIDFKQMSDYVALIKEMSYTIEDAKQSLYYKIDIRLIDTQESSVKLYIIVVQKIA